MDVTSLSPEQMELLAELEHIRWCRYHQFHNWRMGIPKNGARKDATLRIHKDLIPYDELTEEEKEKIRVISVCCLSCLQKVRKKGESRGI